MIDLTDEAVKALLDGATPGPWAADGEPQNRIIWSPDGNRVCFMAHSSGLNDDRDIATSNLVTAAPELARALLEARAECEGAHMIIATERAEVIKLRAENARLRADAKAAVALVVERAVEAVEDTFPGTLYLTNANKAVDRIRALALASHEGESK